VQLFSRECYLIKNIIKLNFTSHDHYGHGNSGPFEKTHRDRCQIKNFDETAADLSARMRIAKDEYPDLPFILYGHSMGGLISSVAIMNDKPQLDGLILSAPALKVKTYGPVYYKSRFLRYKIKALLNYFPRQIMTVILRSTKRQHLLGSELLAALSVLSTRA
jgi:alpha-beta hydrolase superfamily lysophospholipase